MKKLLIAALILSGCTQKAPEPTRTPEPEKEHALKLSDEQREQAGVTFATVEKRSLSGGLSLSGVLTEDADRKVQVTSPLAGKVTELRAGVGSRVAQGDVLAVIDSLELGKMKAEFHSAVTESRLADQSLERRRHLSHLSDAVYGPMEEARKELTTAQADLKTARASFDVADAKCRRVEDLLKDGITSQAQAEQARSEARTAKAHLEQAQTNLALAQTHQTREKRVKSLGLLSMKETQEAEADQEKAREREEHLRESLEMLKAEPDSHGSTLEIRSSLSGTVITRPVSLGQVVSPAEALFSIVDISHLWLWIDIPENKFSGVREGLKVQLSVPAYPGETFQGRISFISPDLDAVSRSIKARVLIANGSGRLKPHMSASVRVQWGGEKASPAVPQEAIQSIDGHDVVYVSSGDALERRAVRAGASEGGWTEILEGLKGGEKVVAKGSFVVKSQDLKDRLGDKD